MDLKNIAGTGFEPVSTEEWKEQIVKDLKGKPYEKLLWQSLDGIEVQPFYTRESMAGKTTGAQSADAANWRIRQDFRPDGKDDQAALQEMAEGGVDELDFYPIANKTEQMARLLTYASRHFSRVNLCAVPPSLLSDFLPQAGKLPNLVFNADPISPVMSGDMEAGNYFDYTATILNSSMAIPCCMLASGHFFHNCGATPVQELALSLAAATEYMHELTEMGRPANEAFGSIRLELASGTDFFMEIAKFRAAHLLWHDLAQSYGLPPAEHPADIAAHTSVYHYSVYDMYTNQLRATTGAMAAILGGAGSVLCTPLDSPAGAPNAFTRRIARNIQHLLREEAHLHKVADPARGAYCVEDLTMQLRSKAMDMLQEIENKGGLLSYQQEGMLSDMISQSNVERFKRIVKGKSNMLGVNIFPNTKEKAGQLRQDNETSKEYKPNAIRPYRMAEIFEELRMQTERQAEPPSAFLLSYGKPAWRTARASFAANFLGVAGFGIIENAGFESVADGAKAAAASGAKFVVACSSDDEYPDSIGLIRENLNPGQSLIVAGNPGEKKEMLKKLGADEFIHMKSNMIITLSKLQEKAEIR